MNKPNVYQEVTNAIIEELEAGNIPWISPYDKLFLAPKNLTSLKAYHGINTMLLNIVARKRGYDKPYYLTYKQAQSLGGNVKQGEKGIRVIYFNVVTKKDAETDEKDSFGFWKFYTVFNVDQCENIKFSPKMLELMTAKPRDNSKLPTPEEVISRWTRKPEIRTNNADTPHYSPTFDHVSMPDISHFEDSNGYYDCLFHELAHSTGHKDRLNRFKDQANARFGSEVYSQEELIAEMASAFLCNVTGIKNVIKNQSAYIQSWLRVFKSDTKILLNSVGKAQKASEMIYGKDLSE